MDYTATFIEIDGSPVWKKAPVRSPDEKGHIPGEKMTLKEIILTASGNLKLIPIGNGFQHEHLSLEESLKRYTIMQKVQKEEELTTEEKTFIRSKLPEVPYPPFLVGQICEYVK